MEITTVNLEGSNVNEGIAISTSLSSVDIATVDEIISFWFGGNMDENYKTKWFPTSSKSLQQQADEIITNKYRTLLYDAMDHKLDHWLTNKLSTIALILILDQFSRHIYRKLCYPAEAKERVDADQFALSITEQLIVQPNWDENLSIDKFIFSLMPLRHSPTIGRLEYVLESIQSKVTISEKYLDLLQKFSKQTLRRLQHLQDRHQANEAGDILEHHEFQSDETNILNESLVHSTREFLEKYISKQKQRYPNREPVVAISLSGGVDSMVIAKILVLLRSHFHIRELYSMHIDYSNREESKDEAAFVKEWAERHGFIHFERVICEVKRGVTDRSEYEKITRNIRYGFYKEILRTHMGWVDEEDHHPSAHPNAVISLDSNSHPGLECGLGVIFGHHAGDVQENVLSNIMRGCSPLSLAGMHESGITEGVPVWRPLLKHIKDEIFAFAHKYGVPYFRDTTPTWSTRGKLRRQLIPLLIDMYGTGCLRNITSLATQSDEAMTLVSKNIYDPFLRTVQRYPCGLVFNVIPYRHQPLCFWKEMLKHLMHSMSMNMIREKAVLNFLKRIQLVTPIEEGHLPSPSSQYGLIMQVPGWLELRKGFYTYLTLSGELIIFRDGVITSPIDERDEKQKEMKQMESTTLYDVNYNGQIGSWRVRSMEISSSNQQMNERNEENEENEERGEEEDLTLEDLDDVIDFQSILNGQFCYLLELPIVSSTLSSNSQLRLCQPTGRPLGCSSLWNVDSKLRGGVPFLIPNVPEGDKKDKKKKKMTELMTAGAGVESNETDERKSHEGRRIILKYVYSPL